MADGIVPQQVVLGLGPVLQGLGQLLVVDHDHEIVAAYRAGGCRAGAKRGGGFREGSSPGWAETPARGSGSREAARTAHLATQADFNGPGVLGKIEPWRDCAQDFL